MPWKKVYLVLKRYLKGGNNPDELQPVEDRVTHTVMPVYVVTLPKMYRHLDNHDSTWDMGIHDISELKKSGNKSAWEFRHDW
jgi:hypothetical protein